MSTKRKIMRSFKLILIGVFLQQIVMFVINVLQSEPEWQTDTNVLSHGYSLEVHEVTTSDGYILQIHRISGNNTQKYPVLILHGLGAHSSSFVVSPSNISLAYMLTDVGYDVWLGNLRGTPHCQNHKTLNPKSKKFWSYSMEDMALNDLPAIIDYMTNTTNNSKVYFVGHSMGATLGFILLSIKPEYNNKIQLFIAEAPAVFLTTSNRLPKILSTGLSIVFNIIRPFGFYTLPPLWFKPNWQAACSYNWFGCRAMLFFYFGLNNKEWSRDVVAKFIGQHIIPFSTLTYDHYFQMFVSQKFQRYDWGSKTNMKVYKRPGPPDYPIELITTPTVFFCGLLDYVTWDSIILSVRLPKHHKTIIVNDIKWTHLDFFVAHNVSKKVNYPLMQVMKDFS